MDRPTTDKKQSIRFFGVIRILIWEFFTDV